MTLFLTSSPFAGEGEPANRANGFVKRLCECVEGMKRALLIASDPENIDMTEEFSSAVRGTLELTGIVFEEYRILDGRNASDAAKLVAGSDFIILAGGHVPTQNRFFQEIGLKELFASFDGVVLGVSAGTMNCADVVYAQPELEGEGTDPEYRKFLSGLNLTKCMILPHYQYTKNCILDGKRIFEDITYPDSMGHTFYALPDGSYLYSEGGEEKLCGEVYRICDGICTKVCSEGEELVFNGNAG
ncbi:MAG: Type 1 glutamine amidotransferase-like domain-containing protein [Lachnospiraceae bacterium]|nr:Type 1 glutamine amidotransferase-like domain-containing protein [Lachnospiraceae bacterium]